MNVLRILVVFFLCTESQSVVYQLVTTAYGVDYEAAKTTCSGINMQLAIPRTATEYNEVKAYLNTISKSRDMWIGMKWDPSIEKFRWDDNSAPVVESLAWTSGEPNCMYPSSTAPCSSGNINQNCARITRAYGYKSSLCSDSYDPLCQELEITTVSETTEETTTVPITTKKTTTVPMTTEEKTTILVTTEESTTVTDAITAKEQTTTEKYSTVVSTTNEASAPSVCPACACPSCTCIAASNTTTKTTVKELVKELTVDKTTTNSFKRAHTSAPDGRTSSKMIGGTGIAILCLIGSLFIIFDLTNLAVLKDSSKNREY